MKTRQGISVEICRRLCFCDRGKPFCRPQVTSCLVIMMVMLLMIMMIMLMVIVMDMISLNYLFQGGWLFDDWFWWLVQGGWLIARLATPSSQNKRQALSFICHLSPSKGGGAKSHILGLSYQLFTSILSDIRDLPPKNVNSNMFTPFNSMKI